MLKTYKIQDICMLEKGKQIDTSLLDDNNPYQYINGGISASGYYDKYNTKENTIIVSEGGASCGYVNFMTEKFWCGCHCYRLMEPKVKSEYLYYALKANQHGIMRLRSGCAMPNIKKTSFYNMQIKLDNNQDNQIKVTSILKKVTTLILKRKEQLTKIDFLVKSRFIEMFGDFPLNEKKWETGQIRNVVYDVRYGTSLPASLDGKYPYFRMNNITYSGELDLSEIKRINIPDREFSKYAIQKGDVLFNRTNSKELVGKTCVYDKDDKMILAGFIIRIRVNDRMLPEFLSAFLNADFSKKMLLEKCKTAIGQANINAQELQNFDIYIPPIELQKQFVFIKNQLDKSKFRIKKSLEKLEMTYKALLQEYFG